MLYRDISCISDKVLSLHLANVQASCSSSETVVLGLGELLLPNGDCYSGTLLGNMPDGQGKYVWSDGCTYKGEWKRGMRHGNGKISWPSGAIYEGEFSGGYMHGTGSYVRADRLTYKGRWKLNLKHGLGYQSYPNGDFFEGSWIQGTIEGPGKYVWANENVFVGNMKGGKMCGKGTLTWKNGDMFEGNWLNGMMHGFGVYSWSDGGCYVGTWTRGLKDGKGAFHPQGSKVPAVQVYINALRKRGVLLDLNRQNHGSHIENQGSDSSSSGNFPKVNLMNYEQSRNKNVSLERHCSLEVAIEKVIGHDVSMYSGESFSDDKVGDANVPILEREYMQGVLISELVVNNSFSLSSRRVKRRHKKLAKDIKKPGETIIKGHRSYDLMLSLQLGIR